MSIHDLVSLPSATVRLLGSSQVITSVYSVVKELTENAVDAQSTAIEVKLDNFGLDRIEVRDNGTGIKSTNIPLVARRYHTSKISAFSDLESVTTYGFRGEALGSLCSVSTLSVTSKVAEEDVSRCYTFDHQGNVTESQPSHLGQGTTICASQLFRNLPVRRQYYNTIKKKKDELKKIEDLLMSYGAIRPELRLLLKNNKDLVWQKTVMADRKSALLGILGRNVATQLEFKKVTSADPEVTIEAYLPKPDSTVTATSRSTNDRCFVAVNQRPVVFKEIEKCVRQHYCHSHQCDGTRHPVYFLSITLPGSQLDVNVDPNKTKVMLHNQKEIYALLTNILEGLYGAIIKAPTDTIDKTSREDMTLLDSSTASLASSDISFGSPDLPIIQSKTRKISSKIGSGHGPLKETNAGQVAQDKATIDDKFTSETLFGDLDSNEGQNQVLHSDAVEQGKTERRTGLRISFYDSSKSGNYGENAVAAEMNNKVCNNNNESDEQTNIDGLAGSVSVEEIHGETNTLNENMTLKTKSDKDVDSDINKDSTVGHNAIPSTQVEKGYFNLIDLEMEDLLVTQSESSNNNGEKNIGANPNVNDNVQGCDKVVSETNELSDTLDLLLDDSTFVNDVKNVGSNSDDADRGIDWSKGVSEKQTDGQTIQPVMLLNSGHMSKKRPSPSNESMEMMLTPPAKKRLSVVPADQPTMYDIVGKSPADKHGGAGFAAFSKEARPKIVEANQSADYDTITELVKERWNKLPDGIKQRYGQAERTEVETVNKKVKVKRRLSQKINNKLIPITAGLPSIKDQLLAASKRKADNKPEVEIKTVKIDFSLVKLKKVYNTGTRPTQTQIPTDTSLQLIGPLKFYNGWACYHGNKILLMNPHRVEETLVHQELLENHVLRTQSIESATRINENNIGGKALYNVLKNLKPDNQSGHTYFYLDDKRIKTNGFEIRCHSDQNGNIMMDLVGLATCMPTYGLTDLSEILDLIHTTGATAIRESRPLKVINYLQSEAVRMVRQRPLHRNRDDMVDLLQQMTSLPVDCDTCFHNKPFFHCVFDTNNLSQSQSSQSQ